jgi:hypothetical protein
MRFINVDNALLGAVEITTIQSISYNSDTAEIAASGDADKADTALFKGKRTVRGQLVIQDPVQSQALLNSAKADLKFDGEPEAGGTAKTVTLKNAMFFTENANAPHNALWGQTLGFRCFQPDGTNPVAIATAT